MKRIDVGLELRRSRSATTPYACSGNAMSCDCVGGEVDDAQLGAARRVARRRPRISRRRRGLRRTRLAGAATQSRPFERCAIAVGRADDSEVAGVVVRHQIEIIRRRARREYSTFGRRGAMIARRGGRIRRRDHAPLGRGEPVGGNEDVLVAARSERPRRCRGRSSSWNTFTSCSRGVPRTCRQTVLPRLAASGVM